MNRKGLAVLLILILIGTSVFPITAQNIEKPSQPASRGNWLYVGGSGPGNYSKIQDAIDNASDGDTVFVFHGIYNESVYIEKSLSVIGEDKNNTIIDGQYKINGVVQLKADSIYFSGFSVIHSSYYTNGFGMSISSQNIVANNIISDNRGFYGGIFIEGGYNQINNNTICSNSGRGILIAYTASYNIISENKIIANPRGIWLSSCNNNVITKNYINNNSVQGIYIARANYNEISYNTIENNNVVAFRIESASNDIIKGNIIKNNGEGLVIVDTQSLIITMNSFYDEGIQLAGNVLNYWASHTISNNFINEKPIYFFKSEKDLIVPSDAGQVILASCTNCHVENLYISDVDYGIQLGYSSTNTISNNQFINITGTAIILKNSQENEIFNNNIFNSNNGVFIDVLSNSCNIHDNIIKNNIEYGIYLLSSSNIINKNILQNNYAGLYIDFSYYNTVSNNNFINNSKYHVFYKVNYLLPKSNVFIRNYYDDSGLFLKIIFGKVKTRYYWESPSGEITYIYRTGFNIEWHPAKEPYDIPGMR